MKKITLGELRLLQYVLGLGFLLVLVAVASGLNKKHFRSALYGFEADYPRGWRVSELDVGVVTFPGVYFSLDDADFSDGQTVTTEYVLISSRRIADLIPDEALVNSEDIDTAGELYRYLQAVEQARLEDGSLPTAPGLPRLSDKESHLPIAGAILVEGVRNGYWLIHEGYLYEIYIEPFSGTETAGRFGRGVNMILASFIMNVKKEAYE